MSEWTTSISEQDDTESVCPEKRDSTAGYTNAAFPFPDDPGFTKPGLPPDVTRPGQEFVSQEGKGADFTRSNLTHTVLLSCDQPAVIGVSSCDKTEGDCDKATKEVDYSGCRY